jgi:hypothetical protein
VEDVSLLPDRTAVTPSGKGYWRVDTAKVTGEQTVVIDVPRGARGDAIVSYELPVTPGRMYPGSVRFPSEGSIHYESAAKGRRQIGTVRMDIKRKYKNMRRRRRRRQERDLCLALAAICALARLLATM